MKKILCTSWKTTVLAGCLCALVLASSHEAQAGRHPLPPDRVSVPDGGATVILLGTALGMLGVARRFLARR
jgi:VPDSG-CTERM motif